MYARNPPKTEAAFAFDFIGAFVQLSPQFWKWEPDNHSFFFLQLLSNALKFRSLSVEADEPICLATLLGLRSDRAVSLDRDQGMRELWQMIAESGRGFPSGIIFDSAFRPPS